MTTVDQPLRRLDRDRGVIEEICFIGEPGKRIFSVQHRSREEPSAGVLVCSPLNSAFVLNYGREVELGRLIAAGSGIVQRFHYRGTGNSDELDGELTFDTMTADARRALRHLRETCVDLPIAVVGTRMAHHVVMRLLEEDDEIGPVVLWEPVLDVERHLAEGFRAARMKWLREGGSDGGVPPPSGLAELRDRGAADLLGYRITRELLDSVDPPHAGVELAVARQIRIVRFVGAFLKSTARRLRELDDFVALAEGFGHTVTVAELETPSNWWFVDDDDDGVDMVASETRDWILSKVAST